MYDKEEEERNDLLVKRKLDDAGSYTDTDGICNIIDGVELEKKGIWYYGEPKYLSLVAYNGKISSKNDMSFIVKAVEGEFETLEDAKNEKDIKELLFSPDVVKGFELEEEETYMFTVFFKGGTTGRIQIYMDSEDDDFIFITKQPEDALVGKDEVAYFDIKVEGPHISYLWQYKLAGSDEWVDWHAKKTASISVAYASYRNGMKLRCYLKNDYDNEKYSDEVTLTYSSSSGIKIDATNFPDPLFREYVSKNFDEDGNGVIYPEEMVNYEYISFNNQGNVTTLKGIEFFTELKGLSIWGDGLKNIDLSKNKKLELLFADNNKLAKIDLCGSSLFENLVLFGELTIERDEDDGHLYANYHDDHGKLFVDLNTQVEVGEAGSVDVVRHPQDAFVEHNKLAYFDVAAYGKDIKYQWYYMLKGESKWTPWNGKTTPIISVAYASYRNGMKLKCIATGPNNEEAESGEAVLIYYTPMEITKQPVNVSVNQGELAYFEVTAKGDGLNYLWQYKLADSSTWVNWDSKTTAKIDVAYAAYRNGMKLRCLVSDITGDSKHTVEVQLTYKVVPKIAKQPKSISVNENSLAYFEVGTEGTGLKYLWQYKAAGSSTWTNWNTKTTAKISVAYAAFRDGMSFRCIVTDASGKTYTSSPAVLTYKKSVFKITADPLGTSTNVGDSAEFEVKAEGIGLTYLWQYKLAGSSEWVNWDSKTTAQINVAYAAFRNGMMVRCKVTNSEGKTLTSGEAVLSYVRPFAIINDPVDTTVKKNTLAYFEVKANGEGLTYEWQYKNESDSSWNSWSTKTTAKISVAYAVYRDGMRVRCLVHDERGMSGMTEEATLRYVD